MLITCETIQFQRGHWVYGSSSSGECCRGANYPLGAAITLVERISALSYANLFLSESFTTLTRCPRPVAPRTTLGELINRGKFGNSPLLTRSPCWIAIQLDCMTRAIASHEGVMREKTFS